MFAEYENHDVAIYGGYLEDENGLLKSASGGIATALAKHMIESGGYVAGVVYSKDFYRAEYLITNDIKDIQRLKGSKYIEVDKGSVYLDVKKLLQAGKKVLFFGLPCAIGALNVLCKEQRENLISCELVCHGPTSVAVHKQYIDFLEQTYQSKIMDLSVRHKKDVWDPCYLRATFKSGEVFEQLFYETEYGKAFLIYGRNYCYHCKFRGNNRTDDLMIGDFWGAKPGDSYWNEKGVSVIFSETDKGNVLINQIEGIRLFKTNFEAAVKENLMVIYPKIKHPDLEMFSSLFLKEGLMKAIKKMALIK